MSKPTADPGYSGTWCVHYRSVNDFDTCKAAIKYSSLKRAWPCFLDRGKSKPGATFCPSLRLPTEEEIVAHEAWRRERMERLATVLAAIRPWREAHQGESTSAVMPCPACQGTLHLSISRVNNHVHGRCETPGCVQWME